MIRTLAILGSLSTACLHAAETTPDLLRFKNGDQLHGRFVGIAPGPLVEWQHEDAKEPVRFEPRNLRHLVLRGGNPEQPVAHSSLVELINGDRIPGTVSRLDEQSITLETGFAGNLEIPRDKIAIIAPNPLGGRVYYHGPFSTTGWDMINPGFPEGLPKSEKPAPPRKEDDESPPPPSLWHHAGAAWYWQSPTPGTALIRRDCLPERSIVRFKLSWKSHLNLALALNADFSGMQPPPGADAKVEAHAFIANDTDSFARIFGNSQVLQINSNYMVIYRASVEKDGSTSVGRVQVTSSRLRLGENSDAEFELRINRNSGETSLFVDGDYVTQWNSNSFEEQQPEKTQPALGNGLAFMAQYNEATLRLSDVIIAEWNGMPDSARSLQIDDQDIILLTNGLDRIAGTASTITEDGKLVFKGKHGNFAIPMTEVAEVRFARNKLASKSAKPNGQITIRLSPLGMISGVPTSTVGGSLQLKHPVLGNLNLSTSPAVMLEFDTDKTIIDDWDVSF